MKLKNKIFLILGIFFIVLLGMITNSKATMEYEMSNGEILSFESVPNDGNPDFVMLKYNLSSSVYMIEYYTFDNTKGTLTFSDIGLTFLDFENKTSSSAFVKYYEYYSDSPSKGFVFIRDIVSTTLDNSYVGYFSNKDIPVSIRKDGLYEITDEILFPGAPLPIPMVEPMKVGKVEELPTLIIQIVEMIIPVFLIIFGTLLVLYLIKSKNLLQL